MKPENNIGRVYNLGQSIWYDFISREFLRSSEFQELMHDGLRGMTSNPTIFEKSILGGDSYDAQIRELGTQGKSAEDIGTALFTSDIIDACDAMRPVFDAASGADGFVSLEVNPKLAGDTDATIAEARRLWSIVNRPNLMIKIPATPESIPAVRMAIAEGINVNVTLMFSVKQYRDVAHAYINGLTDRMNAGHPIDNINSVASVFVSRIDAMIDDQLTRIATPEALDVRGKAGLANSKLVYAAFKEIFGSNEFKKLQSHGARVQRPLWASTSTKNPQYDSLMYVTNLIGPDTVNTLPPETLSELRTTDKAIVRTVDNDLDAAREVMRQLMTAGIDIDAVMAALLKEGVRKFEVSFDTLMAAIEQKRSQLVLESIA